MSPVAVPITGRKLVADLREVQADPIIVKMVEHALAAMAERARRRGKGCEDLVALIDPQERP